MANLPPQYPLLGQAAPYNSKLLDPGGKIAGGWLPEPSSYMPLLATAYATETQLDKSRKRYRAAPGVPGTALPPARPDSGDEMIITDCEAAGDQQHGHVHPPKRRLTASAGPEMLGPGVGPAPAGGPQSSPANAGSAHSCRGERDARDHVHPCTPQLAESPSHSPNSPVSEMGDTTQQLVLPLPLASPVQSTDAGAREAAETALEQQLLRVPTTQGELVDMIVGLSGFVLAQNRNHLVFQLLQNVGRLLLLALCGAIQKSLDHDILAGLPLELALNVLLMLDARSLLAVAQVSRRWHALVANTKLWCYLLRRDNLLASDAAVARELADPAKLFAEWASPSPHLTQVNYAQLLYKKRHLIFRRWMDPAYEPKRISIAGHGSNIVTCLQHDEEKVITGIEGKLINVHSTRTGQLSKLLQGHEGGVWALKYFSNTLVSGSTDRDVRVWNIRTGRCTHVFRGHTSTVRCLDILHPVQIDVNENGQPVVFPEVPLLVTGSRDHNLHVWKLPLDNEQPNGDEITQTQTFDSKDPNNPYLVSILSGHTQSVRSVTGYGNIVISGSYDTTVRVWDLRQGGRCKHVLEGHTDKIYSTALNFKTKRCFSGSMDLSINVWDFEKGKLLYSLEGHNLLVGLLELSEKYLVSAAADSTLRVWDPQTGENLSKLKGHNSAITCFQHDGLRIVSGSERMLKLWDIKTGKFVRDLLSDITGSIWQVSFDADRCVAAVQTNRNDAEETYIEILDFSTPLNETREL
ncbi:WD40 repeat-like protein [Metschnikowia bicuspidata var. bicuspidata NRRL YB-4993]|uniref:WD40 repeat-like protein n=1 Tax=Metschnikowia bicuspidata var. bicuspidata NRRL YB-4993 TaxID=869754 RepID=A0A1A0H6U0_9ASCO|nr:WD40 repeat-like protein [Metschnikowia bicuspidata var. bicuspidata NRRL YB-4993]OBA19746.1 WD40 repeat-like protein [Metschnikowia bicuspidata var. bicuspidata NRRL YB-4993]